ncbi:hypothetical protein [Thalassotalea sp. PS06]|uniref:hypothetical protein n=1 Tax=Thalassotalea sp. PS06 TaxID=2594005 RepID=UPI001162BBF6|nr:hypothetical protein [Thalassotalea sp. PS06]QDP01608.1 hypothetical protein FNC98_09835 [Thalassotalea sp. PS06]
MFGTAFNSIDIGNKTIAHFNKLTELALDRESETRNLVALYKLSVDEPKQLPKTLKWLILLNYESGQRCIGEYCDQFNFDTESPKTNAVVVDFLDQYPDEKCSRLDEQERVACNLEKLP